MRSSTILATLAVLTSALAYDDRLLFGHKSENGTKFCQAFKCACINYEPKNTTLYFSASNCQPGDYSGKKKNTEALAYCVFGAPGSKVPIQFSKEIGKKLGAKVIPDTS